MNSRILIGKILRLSIGPTAALTVAMVGAHGSAPAPSLFAATPSAFHVHLLRSQPAEHDTLAKLPATITLWFSEAPELAVTSVKLTGADQRAVSLDAPKRADASLGAGSDAAIVASVKDATKPGVYTVAWKTAAKDGHPASGTYSFVVAPKR
ncbi:MAG: copper resistance CopC family protein [bacterium]